MVQIVLSAFYISRVSLFFVQFHFTELPAVIYRVFFFLAFLSVNKEMSPLLQLVEKRCKNNIVNSVCL